MKHARALLAALSVAVALAACSTDSADTAAGANPDLTILGAASTRVLNEDLQELSPNTLTYINAGSSDLVQQLVEGAPGDLLITADQKNMDDAVAAGVVADPKVVATNSMVLVVPKDNPANIQGVEDLEDAKVVICDEQVPCGAVSRKLIAANNLEVTPVSLEHNVTDTLGKVTSGEADAGFVYRTDAAAAGDAVLTFDIPHADEHPNSLVAAVTTNTENPEASAALLALLLSSHEMWTKHGFTPVQDSSQTS